jgi:hypothetical protein
LITEGNKKIKIGDVFGELTVKSFVGKDKNYRNLYLCKCSCITEIIITDNKLLTGTTKSCGCLKKKRFFKHGMSKTKIYQVWQQMIERCHTETCKNYYKYGAKGITVCEEWKKENGFINFYNWAMGNGYYEGLTIDRKNTYGNYEPNNCRWTTYEEQNTNLRMLKTNKSGYRGCFYLKKYNKWLANISIKNKTVEIGIYNTLKECVEARNNYIDENNLPHQKNIWIEKDGQNV